MPLRPREVLNIALVDDDADVLTAASRVIEGFGHQARVFGDGAAAIEYIGGEGEGVDLVICDVRMPDMDGFEVLRRVTQVAPDTEVVLMTGYADMETSIRALRFGALDFLIKPFKLQDIEVTLERLAGRKSLSVRRSALARVRDEVWRMAGTDDIVQVMAAVLTGLKALEVPVEGCTIHIVDPLTDPPGVTSYRRTEVDNDWRVSSSEASAELVLKMWRAGRPTYRPELATRDVNNERERVETVWGHPVQSILDVPFSHGVLGINSTRPHAFSTADIAQVEELVAVLSEGYRRLEDLQRLALSEARYRGMVETTNFAALLLDRFGNYLYAAPRIESMTGFAPAAYYKDADLGLSRMLSRDAVRTRRAFRRAIFGIATPSLELPVSHKDGRRRWLSLAIFPVSAHDGSVESVQVVLQDVTERQQLVDQLRQLSQAVEQSPATVIITDAASKIEYVNPKFAEMTGYAAEEVLGRNPRLLKSGKQSTSFYRNLWETIAAGREWRGELQNRRKDGRIYWAAASISPVREAGGKVTHFVAVEQDITALKDTAATLDRRVSQLEYLDQLHQRLRESASQEEAIAGVGEIILNTLERLGEGSAHIQCDDEIRDFGTGAEGLSCSSVPLRWGERERGSLRVCAPPDMPRSWKPLLLEQTAEHLVRTLEIRELQSSLARSSRLVSLGQMAAGMGHELNQPLSVITTLAEGHQLRMAQGMEISPERQRSWCADILAQVDRMVNVIDHMRVFSRDHSHEQRSPVSLNQVVDSALKFVGAQLKSCGIDLHLELAPDVPAVQGDPYRLEEVVLNLVANARDALDERENQESEETRRAAAWEKRLWIRTSAEADGSRAAAIEVEDAGTGIGKEDLPRLFQPFYTTKESIRGTGLGLALSYAIVKEHGGEIACESQLGKGSCFRAVFPATL